MTRTSALHTLETRHGLPGLSASVERVLATAPDPDAARRRAVGILESALAHGVPIADAWDARPEALAPILWGVCAVAPFLATHLTRHPDGLGALWSDDLAAARGLADYQRGLDVALSRAAPDAVADALRRFKYRELTRITVRDAWDALVPEARVGETLAELSALAEALLGRSLRFAQDELDRELGPARWSGPEGSVVPLGFCVLALGKLGSAELNYSSDVDLVYVHATPPETTLHGGPGGLSPGEYFGRLARAFGLLVTETTDEGFLYRVDLELRPEGAMGGLVVSTDHLSRYYEGLAATWEKTAFMKTRPVAGDLDLGWRVVRDVHPTIYQSSIDLVAISAIRDMKARVEEERLRGEDAFDVKLGAGGIRDLEFVTQTLQLLHGGRVPQVRGRSVQGALAALAGAGLLPREEAEGLLASYRFLRRVENRLQMEAERQTHRLPEEPRARERLARVLGYADVAGFDAVLESHRRRVRERFEALLPRDGYEQVLDLFARQAPSLIRLPGTRSMVEDLARSFAQEIGASADPQRGLNNLVRFVEGVGERRSYYELLLDRPELVPRLAALFGASNYLSAFFATHPDLIASVFRDPDVLLLPRAELVRDLREIREELERDGSRDPAEVGPAALRLFHHRQFVNVGLLDLVGKVSIAEAQAALGEVAEVCLEEALDLARQQLEARMPAPADARATEFLVVAMGKLASHELSYGSDLDVIFLFGSEGAEESALAEAQAWFVRLAQKLVALLQTRTAEGVCFEVDARLRPSGSQGMLVTSLASFESYHARSGQAWERQALLRARPVAGSARLGERFRALRRQILGAPPPPDLAAEIHRIRLRVERELAREGDGRRDFKSGRGGMVDVENVVAFLQLQHGRAFPALFEPEPIAVQLERLESLALLSGDRARTLREAWDFLQRLSSRLRIVENRSISDLDEERTDLEAVARALGHTPSQRTGSARLGLLRDYRRHTEAVRRVYEKILGVA